MMLGIQIPLSRHLYSRTVELLSNRWQDQHPYCGDQTLAKSLIDKTISPGIPKDDFCSGPDHSSQQELDSAQVNHSSKVDAQNAQIESPERSGSRKARETLNVFATAVLPIIGALGTLSVFLIANFYVGDVEVSPASPFHTLEIHAYNKKGQEAIFHSPRFQLMPDDYHFEITVDSALKQHADAAVQFRQKTLVKVSQPTVAPQSGLTKTDTVTKKHWWQLWKKTQDKRNSSLENRSDDQRKNLPNNQQDNQSENQKDPKAKND
jgi:hypothetical protein